jgi:hypothetical protein
VYERKTKEDELLGYRIEIAQANYNYTNMSVIRFDIDKNDLLIMQAIESNYTVGSTVSFEGIINYNVHTECRTEQVEFGDPIVRTFVVSDKVYRITGGNSPFDEKSPMAYQQDEIKKLIEAYKAADVRKLEAAKSGAEEEKPAVNSAMDKITRRSSLI